jgi:hypothetical protein
MWKSECGIVLAAALALSACQERPVRPPPDSYTAVPFSVRIEGGTESAAGATVKPEFFTAGGLKPLLGRFFVEEEYRTGTTAVAVISHRYWVSRFQSTPAAIGSRIDVNGRPTTIVGVAHPRLQPEDAAMIWIPEHRR